MEHHISFPFTRSALLRLCAVACIDAKRMNLTPLVNFMGEFRDTVVARVNLLAAHEQRQLNLELFITASPRWMSFEADLSAAKKPVLPREHFQRWFRSDVHNPLAAVLRADRQFSGTALRKFQHVFEAAIVDALRRGRRPDDVALMSHHDMVVMKLSCYAKYLHPSSPALTADDVDRFVGALEFPILPTFMGNFDVPGVDIEPLGMATLRRITTAKRTFPCNFVTLDKENKKDDNDANNWHTKPERIGGGEIGAAAANARTIEAFAALHGFQLRRFDVKKHGVYSLFGAGAQPVCDVWIDTFRTLASMMEREGAKTWAIMKSVPYNEMTTRQVNGLIVGLMTRDELIAALSARQLSDQARADLGIGADQGLADASVHRLRMFTLKRMGDRVIPVSDLLLARRNALIGRKSGVISDAFVVSTGSEIAVICGGERSKAARALLATAICDPEAGETIVLSAQNVQNPRLEQLMESFGFVRIDGVFSVQRDNVAGNPGSIARLLSLDPRPAR